MTTTLSIKALPKQMEFLRSAAPECGYSGAWGAGKSRALCLKLVKRAMVPGAREWLVRRTLVSLKQTTLLTLLEPEGDLPPVLPEGYYEHNKADRRIKIRGGGEIMYDGLEDARAPNKGGMHKHGSVNVSGLNIDEAVELSESDYQWARSRVRLKIAGLPLQTNWASNPGPPSHFLAERFGLALDHKPQPGTFCVQTAATDNFFLPAEYVEQLKTYTGLVARRYVQGLWVGSDGLVYDKWDRARHVARREGPWVRRVVWVDEGYTNPFVALLACEDALGRWHIAEEFYRSQIVRDQKVGVIRAMRGESVVVDPSAAELIAELREAGLGVVEADNSVFDGIMRVQQVLERSIDGLPGLTVDPSCENVCREMETYEWKPGRDEPVKQHDHAMDAIRYGLARADSPFVGVSLGEYGGIGSVSDEDDRGWSTWER